MSEQKGLVNGEKSTHQAVTGGDRRNFLIKGAKALAAIGVAGAVVAVSSRDSFAGCCTACNGRQYCCEGTPTCGIR